MAIIAHNGSFFLELCFLGLIGGEGKGGGEQGFRGNPHEKEFPINDELGNVWREDRELFWRFNIVSCVKFWIDSGKFPVKELNERSKSIRRGGKEVGIFPSVLDGIGPLSPTAGRRRPNTRVPSEVQLIPTQKVQTAVLLLQLSFGPWGTALANARRACVSEFKSAHVRGRRKAIKKINLTS
ncbi:hypothetical protein QVD17_00398 [Tagetes erecta]|uniref:Uncharacterized protein n=1 Tax=Tagetes erecta TaxID=13708 RepID=A0AAD8L5Q3_TARER|nr:hypothetical protein QVD17_00398 [Tagetes erecta]